MARGRATILNVPKRRLPIQKLRRVGNGGWAWKDSSYTAMSGQDRLDKLVKLLRKQGIRHRVLDHGTYWEVLWV